MKALLLLVLATPALGQVTISLQPADHATIPGSVRSIYADVEGTPNLKVNWSVTGGCALATPVTYAAPQVVTMPSTGGTCTYTTTEPTNLEPNFRSPVSCKFTATSAADPGQSASMVIPVCDSPVSLTTFPYSTFLYRNQFGVIQSDLRGSINTGVTWAITTNPGGAGSLTGGAANRHAVFSATRAGVYVLTATSMADNRKKASTTITVTDDELPAPNSDHTEAVDCTPGKKSTFEVGPARKYPTLDSVPWTALKAGDTVRIHNDDATGSSPTVYHQQVSIAATGSATEPIRICGVPDAKGNKPILDGENATTAVGQNWGSGSLQQLAVIMIYDSVHKFDVDADGNRNILVEGLHIRNAKDSFNYIRQGGTAAAPYNRAASCIRVQTGRGVLIRGNDLDNCNQPIFTNSQSPQGGLGYDLTVEGNYVHGWGTSKADRQHGMYLQEIGLTVQFNYFGDSNPLTGGNVVKSRSILNFLRWNFVSQSPNTARPFDLIEPQAFSCSVLPYEFAVLYHGNAGQHTDCNLPHDGTQVDLTSAGTIAANVEAYHSDYVYGNIFDDQGSSSGIVHYGYDQQTEEGPKFDRRGGTLYYWNNTYLSRSSRPKLVFELASPDGGHSYEFPTVQSIDNVFATTSKALFNFTNGYWIQLTMNSDWVTSGAGLIDRAQKDAYQGQVPAEVLPTCSAYLRCKPSLGHMIFERNGKPGPGPEALYTGPVPFNSTTFRPEPQLHGLATPLPPAIRDQPSNMEYFPATNTIKPRTDASFLGALD